MTSVESPLRSSQVGAVDLKFLNFNNLLCAQDRIAFRDDSPPPRPEPEEVGDAVHFTVAQLVSLLAQFHLSAPSGQISAKGFIDIMSDLDALTVS